MIEIGSSEAPIILGVSSWCTPWNLWAQKTGLIVVKDEPDEVMKSGKRLEDYILDMELEEEGSAANHVDRQKTGRHCEREWQRSTPDGNLEGAVLYEVKALVGQPPPCPRVSDVVQCLHHLLVWDDAESCRLIYFGGLRRERFIIPRHQKAMDRVLRAEEAFLEMVEKETPPPVVAADCDGLHRGWPLVRDEVAILPPDSLAWDLMILEAGREMEEAKERLDSARAQIKAAMGDCVRGVLPNGTTYKWAPDKRGIRSLRRHGRDGE